MYVFNGVLTTASLRLPPGELPALRPQRDGRAHVHPAADVQADPPAGGRAEEVLRQAHLRGRGHAAGVRGSRQLFFFPPLSRRPPRRRFSEATTAVAAASRNSLLAARSAELSTFNSV